MNNGFSGKVRINKMGQSSSTRRLRKGNREKQGMSGSGHDVLYETWCRNADLIFQNASTAALAQGCAGHRRPGDGSAGDTPSQPPPAHSGSCVMQGKDRRPIGIGPKEHPIGHAVRESATVVVFGSTARGSKRKRGTRK
ncbi:hypothetical protein F5144DRAFT_593605 [Chaetomium tenue]|uniref:Uncharacterized protein n=1 Tax=Chaetomium tenue TaxID=1854479 RepID=A0ACB7P031_9PEZI|nr:hypothetical protein F5144DRAFT_593605 [Chaetomium globosum]